MDFAEAGVGGVSDRAARNCSMCIFLAKNEAHGKGSTPELSPRLGGTCGLNPQVVAFGLRALFSPQGQEFANIVQMSFVPASRKWF